MSIGHKNRFTGSVDNLSTQTPPQSPVPGMGRRERRAAETRMRLFRCALQLFAEHGFHNVAVEDITEAADVGKGTFFNYFETKDHVLGVMAEIQWAKVRDAATQARSSSYPIRSVLHRLLLRLAEEPGRNPNLARALLTSFLSSEAVRGIIENTMREGRATVAEIIAIGQQRGEIDPCVKKEKAAVQFFQAFLGSLLLWSLHSTPVLEKWLDDSFQHFWMAIATSRKE